MANLRQNRVKVHVYPKDVQKVDRRGFYIVIYYGQKPKIDKKSKKQLFDSDGNPIMVKDKEDKYFSDFTTYIKPKNDKERQQNKHVRKLVEEKATIIRADIAKGTYKRGGLNVGNTYLLDYMMHNFLPSKNYEKSTRDRYEILRKHFMEFKGRDILITELDKITCMDFYNHLQTRTGTNGNKLSESAYKGYMKSFKYYLEQLYNGNVLDGLSPAKGIRVGQASPEKNKVFLEKHELDQLEQLETKYQPLKQAYLFASYSAITRSELLELKWGDFSHDKENDKWYVNVKRQKTGKPARLLVSEKAMSFILPKGGNDEFVFKVKIHSYNKQQLKWIMLDASIRKQPITFHTSKNNFASMFYRKNKGRHLGSLMKALQHNNLSTTQRYLNSLLGGEIMEEGASLDF